MSYWDSAPAAKKLKTIASEYFTIEVIGHGSNLLQNMNRARLEERFCDFKIQVRKQIIHAHKIVLAEGSDYFRAMLSHPMKESNEGFVEMFDVDFECLEVCVEYIYLGKAKVKKEKLQSLLEVAHRLQLNELCEEAAKNLEHSLSIETFFSTKSVASSLNLIHLREKCNEFALKNLSRIALEEDFIDIDLKYLEFLMTAKDSVSVKCKTFLIWANHDPESRGKEFEEFFLNLDLDELLPSYINFLEQNEPLFYNSNKCLRKVMRLNLPTRTCQDIDLRGIRGNRKSTRFAVLDGISKAIHSYDPEQDMWTELHVSIEYIRQIQLSHNFCFQTQKLAPEISPLTRYFAAIAVGEDIFVFAKDRRNWKLRYSDKNSTWSALPNRSITKYVQAVEVEGLIYAFNEADENSKAVEVYDGIKWSYVTGKPVAGCETSILAVGDSIYCIGGFDGQYQRHCNKYETRKKCWSTLPSMPQNRSCGSAVELDRKIYVIGGFDNSGIVLATCLVFDIETEVWTEVASMSNPRYDFRAVAVAGKIFAIDGEDSRNTVEEFNPLTGKWKILMKLRGKKIVATASVAL